MKPLPCPESQWPTFSALLDVALGLDPAARTRWLAELPAEHASLAPLLADVLGRQASLSQGDWLEHPPAFDAEPAFTEGQRIGPWRLQRPLGSGGMGTVWLAARDDGAYDRDVALKLPHAHLLGGALRSRFARERNILAALNHPHIARFYDAGLDGQQPWLALEWVSGQPITDYCAARALDIPARLALMRQVAAAVQAAHGRLIVHRDLKPANVMVTDAGQVKLLDFGIAKLLDDDPGSSAATELGARAATPDYAAPEQLAGGPITVATDVYALGMMLFELLTNTRPWPARSALGRLTGGQGDAPLASSRAVGGAKRLLRGDLDAVIAKSLEPDPARRYASAQAFADDLGRHLAHQPLQARRIGRWQRLGKFLRRNRRGVALAAGMVLVVLAGVAGVAWQAQRAEEQARRAEAIKDFLVDIFRASDPRLAADRPRGTMTARALLDASVPRIESQFASDPEVRIELLRTVADLYRQLGEDGRYLDLQARQLALVRKIYGPHHPNILDGSLEAMQRTCAGGDAVACGRSLADTHAQLRAAGSEDPQHRAVWWLQAGAYFQSQDGRAEMAQAALEHAVAIYRARPAPSTGLVTALHDLAGFHGMQRLDNVEAIRRYREAAGIAEALPERNDVELMTLYGNLGLAHQQLGQFAEAGRAFQRSAELAERTAGAASPVAWGPRASAARTLHLAGEREAAHREFDRLLPMLPPDSAADLTATVVRQNYGERLSGEGRPVLGIPLLESAVATYSQQRQHAFQLRLAQRFLGEAYARAGRHGDAGRLLRQSLDAYLAEDSDQNQPVMAIRESWGRWLLDDGQPDAATKQFENIVASAGERPLAHLALAHAGLARVGVAQGDPAGATAHSERALDLWSRVTGFRDVRMQPYLQRVRADVLAASGDLAGAQALEDAAAVASQAYDAPGSATTRRRVMRR